MKKKTSNFDVTIIGGGPAGASAALYTARGGISTALIHNGASALLRTERIQNYYGTGEVTGAELYARGIEQAKSVGATVIEDQVTFVSNDGEKFTVSTPNGDIVSKKLVIATGAVRKTSDITGVREYEGRGVSYCAVCDGFFYKRKRVGVLGAGEFAEHEYKALKGIAGYVCLLTNGETPSFKAANTMTDKIECILGYDGHVRGVKFENGSQIELDGLFVALGCMGSDSIAKSLGIFIDMSGSIRVDSDGMTNMKGLYAAGDCTNGVKQIAKAVNDGMNVGFNIVKEFKRGYKL